MSAYPPDHAAGNYPIIDAETGYRINVAWVRDVSHWHFWGIHFRNAKQDGSYSRFRGLHITRCANMYVTQCVAYDNEGAGFYAELTDSIFYRNCDSHGNCNWLAQLPSKPGGSAQGFAFITQNTDSTRWDYGELVGCRAWNNSDNGFSDGYNSILRYDSCWSFFSGYITYDPENPTSFGDGRGFAIGGAFGASAPPADQIIITNCISAYNSGPGYHINTNSDTWTINAKFYNNSAFNNREYGFRGDFKLEGSTQEIIFRNNIAYPHTNKMSLYPDTEFSMTQYLPITRSHNSWDASPAITITTNDFMAYPTDSTDWVTVLSAPRQADGSLPDIGNYLKLKSTSDLINRGIDVGRPYNGLAPDLGAFEFIESEPPDVPNVATGTITKLTPYTASVLYNVSYDGGGTILGSGVCWSTSENPTTSDSLTITNNQEGVFSTTMTNLPKNTTIYVRAYATNASGTSYGENVVYSTPAVIRVKDGTTFQKWNGQFIDW